MDLVYHLVGIGLAVLGVTFLMGVICLISIAIALAVLWLISR